LNESHQALDHSEGCQACHESNRGVTNEKCINCHDHKLIKDQLINRRGLHATFTGSCVRCHPEHKGRDINIIDWKPLGGQEAFDHDRTGFSLKNDHRQIACTSCHVRRMKSGRISFLGLSQECQSCHKGIHKLSNPTLIHACNNCHPPGQALRGMRLRDWLDPHRRFSGLSLEGKHTEQT
jgi:hypothetical protein